LSDLISRAEKSSTQSGDGNTIETVECRKAKTAQWDNRMTVAYQQAVRARELEKVGHQDYQGLSGPSSDGGPTSLPVRLPR
jgi:uncharacterized protein YecT (DUF1311 family)